MLGVGGGHSPNSICEENAGWGGYWGRILLDEEPTAKPCCKYYPRGWYRWPLNFLNSILQTNTLTIPFPFLPAGDTVWRECDVGCGGNECVDDDNAEGWGSLGFDDSIEPLSELWDHLPPDFLLSR